MKLSVATSILAVVAPVGAVKPYGKWFDKYMVVMMENQNLQAILDNEAFSRIASTGVLLSNYHGTTHPSQPNCKF